MAHVLVLAQDECIRFTCAEVLKRFGFRTSTGPLQGAFAGEQPDVILMWEGQVADAVEALAIFDPVPVLVFTWDRRHPWPARARVVRPPFHGERLSLALHEAVQQAAAARRAPALGHEAAAAF